MVKIPRVSNYKEYLLTSAGIKVVYQNGKEELVIANRSLKSKLDELGMILTADGEVIQDNKKDENNINDHGTNNYTKSGPNNEPQRDESKQEDHRDSEQSVSSEPVKSKSTRRSSTKKNA